MAEFYFWGAEEDSLKIINSILAIGDYTLLPDLHYRDRNPRIYERAEPSLFDSLTRKKRVYVFGPYSKEPAFMEELKRGRDDGNYYVSETKGGPVLSLSLPGYKMIEGVVELVPGNFSRRSDYWDPTLTKMIKASDELKQHYERIRSEIKSRLVRKKVSENIWIGAQAWELLSQNKAILLTNGKWWDGKGNFVRSNLDLSLGS